ncbi:MAG TPA: type II toxin-antitoxin system VapB family antitoxin [Conexibacter sp.]|nr:type II toxin-antitoxin system VapB family antitoxin [Conexibacter sp.]
MTITASITTCDVWTGSAAGPTVANAMELHITSLIAVGAAQEIAAATGDPIETVVEKALRERLRTVRGTPPTPELRGEAIKRIQREVAKLPVLDDRSPDEILGYGDDGLPS